MEENSVSDMWFFLESTGGLGHNLVFQLMLLMDGDDQDWPVRIRRPQMVPLLNFSMVGSLVLILCYPTTSLPPAVLGGRI